MSLRFVCPLILILPSAVIAEVPPSDVTIIKMVVEARGEPKPALKYLLLPELKDMQPGNPIAAYMKCFMEQNNFYRSKEAVADREKWLNAPLSDLPENLADYGGSGTRQADYAARLDTPDWQLLNKLRTDGLGLLLPDIQQLRELAAVLKVRYRGQIKLGKFDDAIRTHQTMFALARHLREHPTVIGELVGIAIATIAIGPFEEMIQQPGCPNMYWAISQMPSSLVGLRKGFQGERIFVLAEFGSYTDPTRVWDEDDVRKVRDIAKRLRGALESGPTSTAERVENQLKERLKNETWLGDARKRLIASGLPEAKVKKYPAEQILFLDMIASYEVVRDNTMKWANFPYWQVEDELQKMQKTIPANLEEIIAKAILPAMFKIRMAQARLDQRIAMLQVIEALRLHAAANDGKLPGALSEVKLPLPIDPISGKGFNYKLDGATAILKGTPPKGSEKIAVYNIRYELTIKK